MFGHLDITLAIYTISPSLLIEFNLGIIVYSTNLQDLEGLIRWQNLARCTYMYKISN